MASDVNTWKQKGNVYLWRYPDAYKNFPGWHLATDRIGAQSLLELIARLEKSPTPVYRTVHITEPTKAVLSVPNNRGGEASVWSPSRLKLSFDPSEEVSSLWHFLPAQDQAALSVGQLFLSRIKAGIADIMRGEGDYCIGGHKKEPKGEDTCLWFWW